jgi:hypothetical protein
MKKIISLLYVIVAMILLYSPAHGAMEIVLDPASWPSQVDTVEPGWYIEWEFRLAYTPGDISAITGSTNGFRVWTYRNGVTNYTDNFLPIDWDTFNIGWSDVYDGGFFINSFGNDGMGEDTVGFGGFSLFKPGIVDGFDEKVWRIMTIPSTDGDTLCIDSSYYPPLGEWLWSATNGLIAPGWGGPYCYHVGWYPPPPLWFVGCVPFVELDHCNMVNYYFSAQGDESFYPLFFNLISGPGMLTQLNEENALWSYRPSIDDVGASISVVVEVCNVNIPPYCDTCITSIQFYNYTPTCNCPGDTVELPAGDTAQQQCAGVPVDCDTISWFISVVIPQPVGTYDLDTSGLFTFNSDPSDSGLYSFVLCTTDGKDTACSPIYVDVIICCVDIRGNVDGVNGINVADLTYLVAFLFQAGPPPPCFEDGDVDGSGAINVADLTYLVDYFFRNGPPPPPCP